ncbi:MAG: hypothetical protein AOA65_2106 [Candidatus Bathyarchaeota archaeon BA1]|nr:MAG: hypothetical protein AOA65_2106 [Candidatus Bathyarchaeota archaeon BA1]
MVLALEIQLKLPPRFNRELHKLPSMLENHIPKVEVSGLTHTYLRAIWRVRGLLREYEVGNYRSFIQSMKMREDSFRGAFK